MRWHDDSPPTETLLRETAAALRAQRSMLRDCHVTLAIETHFEFTTHELRRLLEMCEAAPGDWLGICLDTMNLLTMLEDPVRATERVLPWVVSTHIKDGAVRLDSGGLTTYTTPLGRGVVDLAAIVGRVTSLDREVHLSVEDHGGSFAVPIFDPLFLSKFPDLTAGELAAIVGLTPQVTEATTLAPLPREEWPGVCESRLADNLGALRALAAETTFDDQPD